MSDMQNAQQILKEHVGLAREDRRQLRRISFFSGCLFFLLLAGLGLIVWLVKIDVIVPANGALEAGDWAEVKTPIEGIVQEVFIAEGEKVSPGQLLLRLENAELESDYQDAQSAYDSAQSRKNQLEADIDSTEKQLASQVATSEAQLKSLLLENPGKIKVSEAKLEKARVRVTQAEADYRKAQDLYEREVLSGVKRDEAKKDWELALADADVSQRELEALRTSTEAEVSKAEAELAERRTQRLGLEIKRQELASLRIEIAQTLNQLNHLTQQRKRLEIYCSAAGEVLTHRPDQLVGRFVNPGDVLVEVGNPDQLSVNARIAEEYLPKIKTGLAAKVYLPALPYREYRVFDGMLSEIGSTFWHEQEVGEDTSSKNGSATAPIRISLNETKVIHDGQEVLLKPGLTAQVEIVVKSVGVWELVWEEIQKIRSRKPGLSS